MQIISVAFRSVRTNFWIGSKKWFRSEKFRSRQTDLDRGSSRLVSIQIVWFIDRSTNHELIGINNFNIYKLLINQVRKLAFGSKILFRSDPIFFRNDSIQKNSNRTTNLDRFEIMFVFLVRNAIGSIQIDRVPALLIMIIFLHYKRALY